MTPGRVLEIARRRKWTGLVVAATVLAAAATLVKSLPNLYRATATVVVERDVSEAFVRPSVTAQLEARIQTIHQFITSREHLAWLIQELDLYPRQRAVMPIEELTERMRGDIELRLRGVDPASETGATIAFTVGYIGRDPQTVAMVVNRLVAVYITENASTRERQAEGTAAFLRRELDQVRRTLERQEAQTRTFARTHTAELPQQLEVNLAAMERLNAELNQNGERQLRLLDMRERIELELAVGTLTAPVPDTTSPPVRLALLQQQLSTLTQTYGDAYPDVKRLTAEIAALERELGPQASAAARAAPVENLERRRQSLAEIDKEVAGLRQRETVLREQIRRYEGIVGTVPHRQLELDQLSRRHQQTQQRYQALLKEYEDAQAAVTLERGQNVEQFRVLDAAVPPRWASAPNRMMLAVLGLLAAMALGVLGIAVHERLDTTLHSPSDVRALFPGAAVVPLRRLPTRHLRRRARVRFALGAVAALTLMAGVAAATYSVSIGNELIVRMIARGGA